MGTSDGAKSIGFLVDASMPFEIDSVDFDIFLLS
jgi:hypothetical protein